MRVRTNCGHCRTDFSFPSYMGEIQFCSANCRIKVIGASSPADYKGCTSSRYYSQSPRRRQKMREGDRIDALMVFEYFQWRCHLCDKDVDKMVRHPDPLSATLDHIVPLRIGGEHVYENCALAHLECNIKKDREIDAPISLHNARLILGLN